MKLRRAASLAASVAGIASAAFALGACGSAPPSPNAEHATLPAATSVAVTVAPTLSTTTRTTRVALSDIDLAGEEQDGPADVPPLESPPPPPPPPHTHPDQHKPPNDHKPPGRAQTENMAGRLSAESVEETVGGSRDELGRCTTAYATFSARILVGASGTVMEASIAQSSPDDARMRDCVVSALKKLKFASTGNAAVPLSFRLAINPASEMP